MGYVPLPFPMPKPPPRPGGMVSGLPVSMGEGGPEAIVTLKRVQADCEYCERPFERSRKGNCRNCGAPAPKVRTVVMRNVTFRGAKDTYWGRVRQLASTPTDNTGTR